jgi:pSer/pThr/pTyr-binding forkhead associated (FHA) protein
MKVSLVVARGSGGAKVIPIPKFPFVIGRSPDCQLRPASIMVSNRHCAVEVRDGKVFLTDLKSTNGTYVNGGRLLGECELHPADKFQIGPLSFEVRIEAPAAVDQRTPLPPPRVQAGAEDDEAIAAVLLSMGEDGTPAAPSGPVDNTGVPTGGTEVRDAAPVAAGEAPKEEATKPEAAKSKAKPANENTSAAADELLKKYLRRPRKT